SRRRRRADVPPQGREPILRPARYANASCLVGRGESQEGGERVLGLWARRVVRVALRVSGHALLVDDKAGGDGQCPRSIAVELLEVQGEGEIELVEVVREREAQPEAVSHLIAAVGEDLEREVPGADQLSIVVGQLRRDGHETRSERCQIRL